MVVRYRDSLNASDCAIAQALAVVGDRWTLLVVRDIAGGRYRFDELQSELGVSSKVLTERLNLLLDHGICERRPYQTRPPRYEYRLTRAGVGLLPVLAGLQDWASTWLLGDSPADGEAGGDSDGGAAVRRVHGLVGTTVPPVKLTDSRGQSCQPAGAGGWTVLYAHPGAYATAEAYPPGWAGIAGAAGCTLEAITFRDRHGEFTDRGIRVVGVSTQRPDQLAAFGASRRLPFDLVSDQDLQLTASLRLPTFPIGGTLRLKRLTLLIDPHQVIRDVLYPITDPAGSVGDTLAAWDRVEQHEPEHLTGVTTT